MDFKEFLPKEIDEPELSEQEVIQEIEKISPNQVYDIITSKKPDWQVIIYDLVHTEQLDPWDIDIIILTQKYFKKIEELENTDFYLSSKVLLAASLLLRIKSEFLLNKHLKNIDEILFGKKQEPAKPVERIEIDESELPLLIPKTPMSRLRKVTLPELMIALNKAMNTESRRIKREVAIKRAKKMSHVDIPKFKTIDLKDRIKQFYTKILSAINKQKIPIHKLTYSELTRNEREEKIATFLPLLYLNNNKKLWLEQNNHLDEIYIYLFQYFQKNKDKFLEDLETDIEEMKAELSESVEENKPTGLEKARQKKEEKKILEKEVKSELMKELGIDMTNIDTSNLQDETKRIEKEKNIDEVTGFNQEN
jgi:segregation and condensation protein A